MMKAIPIKFLSLFLLGLFLLATPIAAFSQSKVSRDVITSVASKYSSSRLFVGHHHKQQPLSEQELTTSSTFFSSRRNVLTSLPALVGAQYLLSSVALLPPKPSFAASSGGVDANKEKFLQARKSIQYLVDHYDEVCKGGGDNVRRYLGTVVTDAPMVGIMKVLNDLRGEADDLVEYIEAMDSFEVSLRAADTAVYSANFVTFSSARTKPEEYFDNALKECKKMLSSMDTMAAELNLK
jgi:hypothetical protein